MFGFLNYECDNCGKIFNIDNLTVLCGGNSDGSEDVFWCKGCLNKAAGRQTKENKEAENQPPTDKGRNGLLT